MPDSLSDLKDKTVYDLGWCAFRKLFCPECKDCDVCVKDFKNVHICMALIDSGLWDSHFRKRQGN